MNDNLTYFYDIYKRATELRDLCGFVDDGEFANMCEHFYNDFGCHWTEVLNK